MLPIVNTIPYSQTLAAQNIANVKLHSKMISIVNTHYKVKH